MDRNGLGVCHYCDDGSVALRKESVDRNTEIQRRAFYFLLVALRKESVDRNEWWEIVKASGV